MMFITIMTRGAARFFRFFRKTSNGHTKTPVVSHFRNVTKMGEGRVMEGNCESPSGVIDSLKQALAKKQNETTPGAKDSKRK